MTKRAKRNHGSALRLSSRALLWRLQELNAPRCLRRLLYHVLSLKLKHKQRLDHVEYFAGKQRVTNAWLRVRRDAVAFELRNDAAPPTVANASSDHVMFVRDVAVQGFVSDLCKLLLRGFHVGLPSRVRFGQRGVFACVGVHMCACVVCVCVASYTRWRRTCAPTWAS